MFATIKLAAAVTALAVSVVVAPTVALPLIAATFAGVYFGTRAGLRSK